MEWVLWMIAVGVLGLAAVAASGRLGELPGTVTDTPRPHVPTGAVTGADLRGLRFSVVVRGYSMDQVDGLLDRLARQLDAAPGVAARASIGDPEPGSGGDPAPGSVGDPGPESAWARDATSADRLESVPAGHPDPGRPDPGSADVPAADVPAAGSPAEDADPERSWAPRDSDADRPAFFRATGEGDRR